MRSMTNYQIFKNLKLKISQQSHNHTFFSAGYFYQYNKRTKKINKIQLCHTITHHQPALSLGFVVLKQVEAIISKQWHPIPPEEKKSLSNQSVLGRDAKSKDAFVPPKPKELDNAALTGISFEAVKGMKASLNMGSGLVTLSVKGAIPCNKTPEMII